MLQPCQDGLDEVGLSVFHPPLLVQPGVVVDHFKRIGSDCRKIGNRAGLGEEVVAQGFGDPEVSHDAGAHAHRHGLKGRRG